MQADLQHLAIDTLAFVLDDGLRTLPMATLHDGKQFLVENYALSLVPSLHLLSTHYVDLRNSSVAVMGMSEFMEQGALPAVPAELAAIAKTFNAREPYLNETFTLANVRQKPIQDKAQIVHLATHGEFQGSDASDSYIQLWDQPLNLAKMRELAWHRQDVELLVLSACRTAFGDAGAEYGFAGLAVQAGVSSALASLWYANDAGTLALMSQFYEQLRSVSTKAHALRLAQMAMISGKVRLERSKEDAEVQLVSASERVDLPSALSNLGDRTFQHPYYWSGFTLIGSPW